MLNYHDEFVNALQGILPTYHEFKLTSKTPNPCISFMEISNFNETEITHSTTLGYSRIVYQVKISGTDIRVIQEKAKEVDDALRPLGWKRTGGGEQHDKRTSKAQKIMNYERLALENFN